jgi:hypothetical protein
LSEPSEQLGAASRPPFCFNCGYELTGLDLPHACPECGRIADPDAEIAAAQKWFAHEAWKPWAALRPSRIPLTIWHIPRDDQSRRIARQRRRWFLWIPAFLVTFLVLVAYQFESRAEAWLVTHPLSKPASRVQGTAVKRCFGRVNTRFSSHRIGADGVRVVEFDEWEPWRFQPTRWLSHDAILHAFTPWFVFVPGYYRGAAVVALAAWTRHRQRRQHGHVVSSVLAPAYGAFLWSWFVLASAYGFVSFLGVLGTSTSPVSEIMHGISVPGLAMLSLVGWRNLLTRERSGRIVGRSSAVALLTILASCSALLIGTSLLEWVAGWLYWL